MKRVAMSVLGCIAVLACSSLARQAFADPSVTLKDVRVVSLGMTGGELDVHLGVYNPNNYRLDASRLNYRVFVGDTINVASGSLDASQSVQASDSTLVRIPVTFLYSGLSGAARQLLMTGSVTYRVTGDVRVWTGFSNVTVPFSASGRYSTLHR